MDNQQLSGFIRALLNCNPLLADSFWHVVKREFVDTHKIPPLLIATFPDGNPNIDKLLHLTKWRDVFNVLGSLLIDHLEEIAEEVIRLEPIHNCIYLDSRLGKRLAPMKPES